MNKRILAGMLVLIFVTLACGPGVPTQQVNNVSTIVASTIQALTAAAPTRIPQPSGIRVTFQNVSFVLPNGLASRALSENVPAVDEQSGAPWEMAPAFTRFTLQNYSLQGSFHDPQIFIYPAQDYAAVSQGAAESIKRLQAILAKPGASYSNDALPHVPFFNAGQVFASQEKIIQFKNGSGIRIVTQYAQDVEPVNNGGLFYLFEGSTSDGKYYIVAVLPVNLPFLPADNNPDSATPAGGIAFPQNGAPGTSFETYYKSITDLINNTSSHQFKPTLTQLDALIQSITVNP